ncbi:MAG: hypothetical protein KTR14_06835 [Vampirovibrio sp.]|nr:hypothetical protein [Vampirovibrio sp.]
MPDSTPEQTQTPELHPIFKSDHLVEESSENPLSLSRYIADHIRKQQEQPEALETEGPPAETQEIDPQAFYLPEAYQPHTHQAMALSAQNGHQLNHLDTELSAGLEQYLPTPVTRLRMIKERLNREMMTVREDIQKYQHITNPSAEVQAKVAGLKKKLSALTTHQWQVDEELAALYTKSSWIIQGMGWISGMQKLFKGMTDWSDETSFIVQVASTLDPARFKIIHTNRQLNNLTRMLETQLTDPTATPGQIADLVNRYDTSVRELDALMQLYKPSTVKAGPWNAGWIQNHLTSLASKFKNRFL